MIAEPPAVMEIIANDGEPTDAAIEALAAMLLALAEDETDGSDTKKPAAAGKQTPRAKGKQDAA